MSAGSGNRTSAPVQAKLDKLEDYWPKEEKKYLEKIASQVLKNVLEPFWRGIIPSNNWTNNNSESLNHVIKQIVGWQPKPVVELIRKLFEYVKSQEADVKRSLFGRGEMYLSPDYLHLKLNGDQWLKMTKDQQNRHFKKLYLKPAEKVVKATKLDIEVNQGSRGMKPGQRRRPKSEKSRTPSKTNRTSEDQETENDQNPAKKAKIMRNM